MSRSPIVRHTGVALVAALLWATALDGAEWSVYFSPRGGGTDAIVREIRSARREILVQAYSFTSAPIGAALIEAASRGIEVHVLVDRGQEGQAGSQLWALRAAGVDVRIDAGHAIAHDKVLVIDQRVVMTGSFNFTAGAEARNAENLLILAIPALADRYRENWRSHAVHSRGPGERPGGPR